MLSEAEEKKRRLKELKGSSNPEDKEKAKRILWGGEHLAVHVYVYEVRQANPPPHPPPPHAHTQQIPSRPPMEKSSETTLRRSRGL
jgi:hypothetical protein